MITKIIFDLSEVLLYGMFKFEKHLSPKLNMTHEKANEIFDIPELYDFFNGKITEDDYFNLVIRKSNLDVSLDHLKDAVRKNFEEIEGTREIIEKLKENGYCLGLLSVHTKEWIEHCEKKFEYHRLFDSIMYSYEIQVCKPDKEAFWKILKKMGASPNECLFIDDSIRNIKSASEIGMNTILFRDPKQLKDDLLRLSIKI